MLRSGSDPTPRAARVRQIAAALLLLLPFAVLAAQSVAALKPRVENPHGPIKEPCASCHSAKSWKPARISPDFKHEKYGFALGGAHAGTPCLSCHGSLDFAQSKTQCVTCHEDPHRGELGTECARCHGDKSFTERGPMVRAHQTTRFPLTGSHAGIECESCHKPTAQGQNRFVGTAAACVTCHRSNYDAAKNPDHAAGSYPLECETCHNTLSWNTSKFDHNRTAFPLTGAHRTTACQSCHGDGVFAGKSTACASCHQTDYNGTTNPSHTGAGYPMTCQDCHGTASWAGASFDHATTGWPLTGAHANQRCLDCHGDGVYRGKSAACASCHQTEYNATTNPPHQAAAFPVTCQSCHSTATWTGASFDHATTGWALTGAHTSASCVSCHGDGVFAGKSTACLSCHQTDYSGATNPSHSGFPTTCADCHSTINWSGATFDHSRTSFPLTGAHRTTACLACHGDGVYNGKSTACASCHQTDFNGATNPNHTAAGFSNACQTCHTTTAWDGGTFNHNTTSFPLSGAHVPLACNSCHGDNVFNGKSTTCVSCHQTDYNGATAPSHSGFPTTCQGCHTTMAWSPASFNHNATSFPLTGAHVSASCSSCHGDGVYDGKSTLCASCHQSDFNGATNPNHVAAAFSTACQSCHNTTTWVGGTFNHSTTSFPLTGAHVPLACNSCHADNVYNGKSTLCVSCHQQDYNGVTNPNHVAAGFPTACQNCHGTATWSGASFNHNTTSFPLTGAHVAVACMTCHADNVFDGKSTACVSCHQTDYNAATNPNHPSAGFPNTCQSCHTTTAWAPSTWNHDTQYFRIYSGRHRARWTRCIECHTVATDFRQFNCLACHPHSSKTQTDSNHGGVRNYQYNSAACYSCHPRV